MCMLPHAADYEARSKPLVKRSGAFVSVLNSGLANKYGKALAFFPLMYNLVKGKLVGALMV
jgi:hypothetical protein